MQMALRPLAQIYNYVRPQPNHHNGQLQEGSFFQYNMILPLKIILSEIQKEVSFRRVLLYSNTT